MSISHDVEEQRNDTPPLCTNDGCGEPLLFLKETFLVCLKCDLIEITA